MKRRMTFREFSEWLAKGNGQYSVNGDFRVFNSFSSYNKENDNEPIFEDYLIRSWNETEWHEPEVEVKECQMKNL